MVVRGRGSSGIGIRVGGIGYQYLAMVLAVLVLVMAELVEIVLQCSAPQGYEREQPWNWFRPTPPSPALSDDPRGIKGQRNKWF